MDIVKHMKWRGWGEEAVSFQHKDKPTFAAFVKSAIDIDVSLDPGPVLDLAQMEVPPANVPSELISELQRIAGILYVRQESSDRSCTHMVKAGAMSCGFAAVTLGGCPM